MTLLKGRVGGTGVYAEALLAALGRRADVDVQAISAAADGGFNTLRWMVSDARTAIRRAGVAVLHSPAFVAPFDAGVPTVMTIHDLSLGRMPSGHPLEWRMYYRLLLPRLVRRAKAIITPTDATRKDVIAAFGLPPERVVATPLGVDRRFFGLPQRDRSAASREPVIVFPGPPLGRKNLDIVLRALSRAPAGSSLATARLEITGATKADWPRYDRWILDHGLQARVTWVGALPFEDLPNVYARADLLAYPSFMEGFGFPPLEAMATGTPVVASNATCLPEVLGDAAVLVEPTDDAAFAAAVESVLRDPELRRRLSIQGASRAATFTWERCAEMTVQVYRDVAEASMRRSKTA